MEVMGLDNNDQMDILRVVAAILHLSNVTFEEENNNAYVVDPDCGYLEGLAVGTLCGLQWVLSGAGCGYLERRAVGIS